MRTSTKIWLCVAGLLLIILGVVCIAKPDITLVSAAWVLGCFTLIAGVSKLIFTFKTQAFLPNSGTRALSAVLDIFFGCFFLLNILGTAVSLPVVFAIWVMIEGVVIAVQSFDYKRVGYPYWWSFLIFGILATALGIAGLRNPADAGKWLSTLIGLGLVMIGCAHFGALTGIKHFEKALDNAGRTVDIQ
jgi:uncharacterized membrane protein HdeD (DUF308 family)